MKNHFIQRINDKFARLTEWVLGRRRLGITVSLLLAALCLYLASGLESNFDPKIMNVDGDPDSEFYDEFLEEYGSDDFIYILYTAKKGIFDLNTLKDTRKLVEEMQGIEYMKRVRSIINVEYFKTSKRGDLEILNVEDNFPGTQAAADRLKKELLDKPLLVNNYISGDGKYAAIFCELEDRPEDDKLYLRKVGKNVNSVLSSPAYNGFEFHPIGTPLFASTLWDLTEENTKLFSSITLVLIVTLLIMLFRQFKAVIGPFFVTYFSLITILGFMGATGLSITPWFAFIPSVILVISLADSVHIISEYQTYLKNGISNQKALVEAVRHLGFPCLFTSVTTAIGFSSLFLTPIMVIREFGIAIAFGVMAAFFITITALVVAYSYGSAKTEEKYKRVQRKSESGKGAINRILPRIAELNNRHYKAVLIVFIAAASVLGYFITHVEVNTSMLMEMGDKIQIYRDYKFIDKIMGGTGNFEVLVSSKNPDGVKTRKFTETLEKIQRFAESEDYITQRSSSIADIIKEMNRSMHGGDESYYALPGTDEGISQYLLLYELSGGEEIERLVSGDMATARISIFIKSNNAKVYKKFHGDLVRYIDSVIPGEYEYNITGRSFLLIVVYDKISEIMTESLLFALAIISIMMIFVFRSVRVGLISMVPNIFPIIAVLGFMGMADIWFSHLTSIIGCMVIGIIVDDTIHFISRYRMEFDRLGDYRSALSAAMTSVGRALTITTVVLVVGFGVTMLSRMKTFYFAGLLSSVCFISALIADFFIAPALILLFKPFGKEFDPSGGNEVSENEISFN